MRRFLAVFLACILLFPRGVYASGKGISPETGEQILEALDELKDMGLSPMEIGRRLIEGGKNDPALQEAAQSVMDAGAGLMESAKEAAAEAGSSYLESAGEAAKEEADSLFTRFRESLMDWLNERIASALGQAPVT